MRRSLALAASCLALAATFGPLSAASAVCGPDLSSVGGPSCPSLCPAAPYYAADEALGDALPDVYMTCSA